MDTSALKFYGIASRLCCIDYVDLRHTRKSRTILRELKRLLRLFRMYVSLFGVVELFYGRVALSNFDQFKWCSRPLTWPKISKDTWEKPHLLKWHISKLLILWHALYSKDFSRQSYHLGLVWHSWYFPLWYSPYYLALAWSSKILFRRIFRKKAFDLFYMKNMEK